MRIMIGESVASWATDNGWTLTAGRYCAVVDGYHMCISDEENGYALSVILDITNKEKKNIIDALYVKLSEKNIPITLSFKGHVIFCIVLDDERQPAVSSVVSGFSDALRDTASLEYKNCLFCNKTAPDCDIIYKEIFTVAHSKCYKKKYNTVEKYKRLNNHPSKLLGFGVIGAILGGIIGVALLALASYISGWENRPEIYPVIAVFVSVFFFMFAKKASIPSLFVVTAVSAIFSIPVSFIQRICLAVSQFEMPFNYKNAMLVIKPEGAVDPVLVKYMIAAIVLNVFISVAMWGIYRINDPYKVSNSTMILRVGISEE